MNDDVTLAQQFETHRTRLRALAYHSLGSPDEADDAVQEAWIRLSRSDASEIENLGGWLTTVVARVCLDMLRARRDIPHGIHLPESSGDGAAGTDPEQIVLLADSIGPVLLTILHTLSPAERIAFVLHDVFAIPFAEISAILGQSPDSARQSASRGRRRVRNAARPLNADQMKQREVVDAFLAAARAGDFQALMNALDPDVVVRSNGTEAVRGATAVASRASNFAHTAQVTIAVLAGGAISMLTAADGRPVTLTSFTIAGGKITAIDTIDDPDRLADADLSVLDPYQAL